MQLKFRCRARLRSQIGRLLGRLSLVPPASETSPNTGWPCWPLGKGPKFIRISIALGQPTSSWLSMASPRSNWTSRWLAPTPDLLGEAIPTRSKTLSSLSSLSPRATSPNGRSSGSVTGIPERTGELLEQIPLFPFTSQMKAPKLLVDADFFFYRAASAAETEMDYSEDLTVVVGDFRQGKRIVEQELNKLRSRFDTQDLELFFTDSKNFRKEIDPSYKGNRRKRKPAGYLKLKNWGLEKYPSLIMPALEADDALGIAATSGLYDNFVLVSPDKDMQQIPAVFTT